MSDFDFFTTNNTNSYSFGGARHFCQSCQRPFSHMRYNTDSTQAHCPRCNQPADETASRNNISSTQRPETSTLPDVNSQSQPCSQPQQEPQQQSEPEPQPESQSDLQPELHPQPELQPEPQPESQTQEDSTSQSHGSHIFLIQTIVDPLNGRIFIQRIPLTHIFVPSQQAQNNEDGDGNGNGNNHEHEHEHGLGSLLRLFIPLMSPRAFADGDNILDFLLRGDSHHHSKPPASQDAIDKLEKFNYSAIGDEVTCCSVCYEEYNEDEALVRLPCKHEYHGNCVKTWLNQHNSCPMCRQEI